MENILPSVIKSLQLQNLYTPVFDGSGKYNECLGPSKNLQLTDKLIKFHGTLKLNFQQHGIVTGHTVAFHNIITVSNIRIKLFFIRRINLQIYKSLDMIPQKHRIQFCMESS